MVDELLLEDEKTIRIFSDPLHQRMLSALEQAGPQTSSGLARLLGDEAGRLHYHLRRMEAAGLLELDHEEVINGIRARYLRPAARAFRIVRDSLSLGPSVAGSVVSVARTQFSEAQEAFEALVRRKSTGGPSLEAFLTAETLRLGAADALALEGELTALVARYRELSAGLPPDTPQTWTWRFLASVVPLV